MRNIPRPTILEVEKYISFWHNSNELKNYVAQERSLNKLFTKTYPGNEDLDNVLIKVSSLNAFYSTNIFKVYDVSLRIIELNIDSRLIKRDLTLINDIAKVKFKGESEYNFYSFATKYCSHHFPEFFPIYDSFVEKMLLHFKHEIESIVKFKRTDLKNYQSFYEIILAFKQKFDLLKYNNKELDRYLWLAGRHHFNVNN